MTVLVLAGSAEARDLVTRLAAAGQGVLASLAGATAAPAPLGVPTRIGGFGGEAGFLAALQGVRAVIDATHPFAARIGPRSARLCAEAGVPYLRLLRPPWQPGPGDDWREIAGPMAAAEAIPPGATVFLATGRQGLADWAPLAGRRVLARVVDLPPGPPAFPGLALVQGHPGPVAQEAAWLAAEGVAWIIAKNAGGPARGKLDAARRLGLPVLMLPRPAAPGSRVATVAAAVDWLEAL